ALAVGQAEQALLQDRVRAVPQRQGEAQVLLIVADAGEAVLAPPVGAGARLVVAEVVPRIAGLAVVLAHGAPLSLADVRSPLPPRDAALASLLQSKVLRLSLLRHGGCPPLPSVGRLRMADDGPTIS